MLRQIEEALREQDLWTLQGLAARLGTRPELVRAGLRHLVRLGRLPAGALVQFGACGIPSACSGCALAEACSAPHQPS